MGMDEIDVAKLNAEFNKGVICQECEESLVKLGTSYFCQNTACDRFAVACPETHMGMGYTEEEHEAALERQRDADATGYTPTTQSPSYRDAMIDAGRGHLLP